jgi:hypothetical protein
MSDLEGTMVLFKSFIFINTHLKYKDVNKSIFLSALFFLSFQFGFSQVQSVDYSLRYNSETCLFDCYLIINEGETKTTVSRAQFNSQVTIVVPVTSNVFVEDSYMPLKDNQVFKSTESVSWEISNELEQPADLSNSRLVSISPVLAPTAFYNSIKQGDEIKLFSLKVNPIVNCAEGVRLFDNQKDPNSGAKGMMGADFSNGFTIGEIGQKYVSNSLNESPIGPIFKSLTTKNKYGIDFSAKNIEGSSCQNSLSYKFYGPKGEIGSLDDYYSLASKQQELGEYRVIATDNLGCSTEHKFYPFGKEESANVLTRDSESEGLVVAFESSIYPNPSQGIINLTVFGNEGTQIDADIYDLDGKLVKRSITNLVLTGSEQTIKIPTGLIPGVYNLSLNINNSEVVNHKVLIIN